VLAYCGLQVASMTDSLRLLLAIMALSAASGSGRQAAAVRLHVPLMKQPYNLCLPASVSMVLSYWGVEVDPATIADHIPIYKDGTTGEDVLRFVESVGFRGFLIQPTYEELLQHLEKQRPLIVVLPAGGSGRHAMVLVGVDSAIQTLWLNDPAIGQARRLSVASFQKQWDASRRWTFLIVPR